MLLLTCKSMYMQKESSSKGTELRKGHISTDPKWLCAKKQDCIANKYPEIHSKEICITLKARSQGVCGANWLQLEAEVANGSAN